MKAKQNLELKGAVGDSGAPLTPTETQSHKLPSCRITYCIFKFMGIIIISKPILKR